MKYIVILLSVFLLTACQERYRYPCQDPSNWEEKMCKKPYCSANGTCPEDLRHYVKPKEYVDRNGSTQNLCNGGCK